MAYPLRISQQKQLGAALIASLVFMSILTILGISAMRSNTLDVKIHNAMKNKANAFQCAEAALRQGELYIQNRRTKPDDSNAGVPSESLGQVWETDASVLNNLVNEPASWWQTNGWQDDVLSDADVKIGCATAANFIVQSMGGIGGSSGSDDLSFKVLSESQMSGYRISSRSEGVSENATVILQSTFTRQFN